MNKLIQAELFNNLNISEDEYSVYSTIKFDEVVLDRLSQNIGISLSKRKGSSLTKQLSKLNKTNKLVIGVGKSYDKSIDFEVGHVVHSGTETKLSYVLVNIIDCLINVGGSEFINSYLRKLVSLRAQSLDNRSPIETEDSLALRKQILDLQMEMLTLIDYDKLIDRAFFVYLKWTIGSGLKNTKVREKFLILMIQFHFALIKDLLVNTNHTFKESQIQMLKTIIVYSFISNYSNFTGSKILTMIVKHDDFDIETARTIRDIAPDFKKVKGISALAYLLANVGILNVSSETLSGLLERLYGDAILSKLYDSQFSTFVAYLSTMTSSPSLPTLVLPREISGIDVDIRELAFNCKRFVQV